jgi:trimeric autotransporter adhesin
VGAHAGLNATTGHDNVFVGAGALGVAGEGNTIRIGGTVVGAGESQQNRTFINGIRGVTTASSNAISVLISSTGQLGTVSSSRAVKQDIQDLGPLADRLLALRPVAFRYRQHVASDPQTPLEFGLIAEEVAEVLPELVVFDQEGEPETVKYHLLSSLLLAELKDQHDALEEQHGEIAELRRRLRSLEARPFREATAGRPRDRSSAGSRRR